MADAPATTNGNGIPKTFWGCVGAISLTVLRQPNGVLILILIGFVTAYGYFFAYPESQSRLRTDEQMRITMQAVAETTAAHSANDRLLAENQAAALRNHEKIVTNQATIIQLLVEAFGVRPKPPSKEPNHG